MTVLKLEQSVPIDRDAIARYTQPMRPQKEL
jgi:hypothetical protein